MFRCPKYFVALGCRVRHSQACSHNHGEAYGHEPLSATLQQRLPSRPGGALLRPHHYKINRLAGQITMPPAQTAGFQLLSAFRATTVFASMALASSAVPWSACSAKAVAESARTAADAAAIMNDRALFDCDGASCAQATRERREGLRAPGFLRGEFLVLAGKLRYAVKFSQRESPWASARSALSFKD